MGFFCLFWDFLVVFLPPAVLRTIRSYMATTRCQCPGLQLPLSALQSWEVISRSLISGSVFLDTYVQLFYRSI